MLIFRKETIVSFILMNRAIRKESEQEINKPKSYQAIE
jgi:hypothetical protein